MIGKKTRVSLEHTITSIAASLSIGTNRE